MCSSCGPASERTKNTNSVPVPSSMEFSYIMLNTVLYLHAYVYINIYKLCGKVRPLFIIIILITSHLILIFRLKNYACTSPGIENKRSSASVLEIDEANFAAAVACSSSLY